MSAFRCFARLCAKTEKDEAGTKSQIAPDVSGTSPAAGAGVGEVEQNSAAVSRVNDEVASTSQPSATNSQAPKREPSVENPSTPLTENFEVESKRAPSEAPIDVDITDEEFDQIEGRRPPSRGDEASTSCQELHPGGRRKSRSLDDRPTPTNPVTFLQAVIDDVQKWQAQVAAIHSSANSQETKKMDGEKLREEIMKASIGTLQRRNEELLGELDRLSSRLYRAEKEIARMQARLDQYAKENKERSQLTNKPSNEPRVKRHHSEDNEGLTGEIERLGENSQSLREEIQHTLAPLSEEERNSENTAPNSDIGTGDRNSTSLAHDGCESHEASPSGLSKEEYFVTENKCLKMWIAKMQASISHMETEVFAMRQEKSDLMELLSQYSGLSMNKSNKRWQQPLPSLSEAPDRTAPPPTPSVKSTKPRTPGTNPALNRLASRNARQSSRNARLRNVRGGGGGSLRRERSSDFDNLGFASNYVSINKEQDFNQSIYRITPTWKP